MADSKKYGPKDRKQMEADETSKTFNTDLPKERFSSTAQVVTLDETVTPAAQVMGSGDKKELAAKQLEAIKSKIKIKPTADAKILNDTQVGGVPIGSGQAVTMSAAGAYSASGTTVGDSSKIPFTNGGYRPDSRQARKTSDNDFIINNAISEQVVPSFEGTKDLRESPDSLQGYNGQKQFKTARGKKNAGDLPQSTLFDRSIDYHKVDGTVHTTGQVVGNVEPQADYPTITALNNYEMDEENGFEQIQDPMKKSNYVLKTFNFTLKDGRVSAVSFNEDKIDVPTNSQTEYQTNQNWRIDRNNVAKTMIRLQKELGRETTEKWSPLGYVLRQPYQFNMLAHDIEATTGALCLLAYRAANTSLAFQSNNKLAKDGAKPQTPILEMFLEGIGQLNESVDATVLNSAQLNEAIFSNAFCAKGSASAIIKMFDSTSKYTTKANFFNMPRSLKYFVQTMDNNINPLHCKKEFLMAVDTAHVFSTFDSGYNPLLPIVATDKISVVNPMSLNYFLQGWSRDNVSAENTSGTAGVYRYKYSDIRNVYSWELKHPFVEGLLSWMIKHEAALVKAYGANATVSLPCFFSMLAPSMFQSMICAASQEILWARNIHFRDFLFAGDQTEYIWKDLDSLEHLNPKFSSNMTITDYKTGLKLGRMKPASFYHIYWGDSYTVLESNDPAVGTKKMSIMLPWYYNENAFRGDYRNEYGFYKDTDDQYVMSYPEVRIGVCHDFIDEIHAVSERDLRLALDRSIGVPLYIEGTAKGATTVYARHEDLTATKINSQVKINTVRYDKNSDGRVIVTYDNDVSVRVLPNKASIMALPRELGFLYPSFRVSPIIYGVTISKPNSNAQATVNYTETGNYKMSSSVDGSMGHSLVSYAAKGRDNDSISISRTAAIQQDFVACFSDRSDDVGALNEKYVQVVGIVPAITGLFNANEDASAITINRNNIVNPFYNLGTQNNTNSMLKSSSVITLSRFLWAMLNRFFMPVNVFENCLKSVGTKEDFAQAGVLIDPMEASFMFGLAGFFASDFSQDILNRADIIDQLNIDYTEDEFIKSSLIFRAD